MNIAQVKGGINGTVIIDEIDVASLRDHKASYSIAKIVKKDKSNDIDEYKPLPAGYND